MRRSTLFASLWPLRRDGDELWMRSTPNRGDFSKWNVDDECLERESATFPSDLQQTKPDGKKSSLDEQPNVQRQSHRQLGRGEGGVRVVFPHLHEKPTNSKGGYDAEEDDHRSNLFENKAAMTTLQEVNVARAEGGAAFPLSEAGWYTLRPSLFFVHLRTATVRATTVKNFAAAAHCLTSHL